MSKWLEDLSLYSKLDCGDNSCYYKKTSGGMRTNGGCRCSRNNGPEVERFLTRNYSKALSQAEEIEAKHSKVGNIGEGYI